MTKRVWLVFGLITLAIMAPLLLPGYVQTLDLTWGPRLSWPGIMSNTWLFYVAIKAVSVVLTSQITEKLLFVSIFMLAGIGAYRLTSGSIGNGNHANYFAGVMYIINPFVYTRFMAGQYLVLLGYALFPWFVNSLLKCLSHPNWRNGRRLLLWSLAIGFISIHAIGFMAVTALIAIAFYVRKNSLELWKQLRLLGVVTAGWIVLNSFWFLPYIMGSGQGTQTRTFGTSQLKAFATVGDGIGVPLNTLTLQGFWGDIQHRYILPSSTGILFYSVAIAVGLCIVYGLWTGRKEKLIQVLAVAGFLSWIFAMGIAWYPVAGFNQFLFDHVPLWRGYREPEKWLTVLALAYAVLAARGLDGLIKKAPEWRVAFSAAFVLPFLLTPMMVWGAGGQLVSQIYPNDWYAFNSRLATEKSTGKVLALPWHQYLTLSFANGRDVANPAPGFFNSRTVISSANPEQVGVPPTNDSAQSFVENTLLPLRLVRTNAGEQLSKYDVEYVMLLKEADWRKYDWLNNQTDLKLIQDSGDLRIYQNLTYGAKN